MKEVLTEKDIQTMKPSLAESESLLATFHTVRKIREDVNDTPANTNCVTVNVPAQEFIPESLCLLVHVLLSGEMTEFSDYQLDADLIRADDT